MQVRMLVLLVWLDQVPGPHGMRRPAEHHEPGEHGSQPALLLRPSRRPKVPGSQGVGEDEPSAHHDERVHALHAVAPDSSCHSPAEHRRHEAMLSLGAKEPGAHCPGVAAPVAHACPGGQTTQSSTLVMAMSSASSVAF